MSDLRCPGCAGELSPSPFADAVLAGCARCGGIWLDNRACQLVVRGGLGPEALAIVRAYDVTESVGEARAQGYRDSSFEARVCPVCRERLEPAIPADASVTVDVCSEHGTYFDRQELRTMQNEVAIANAVRADQRKIESAHRVGVAHARTLLGRIATQLARLPDE